MKRTISALLAGLTALFAPGTGSYAAAAAGMSRGVVSTGVIPVLPRGVIAASDLQVGLSFASDGLGLNRIGAGLNVAPSVSLRVPVSVLPADATVKPDAVARLGDGDGITHIPNVAIQDVVPKVAGDARNAKELGDGRMFDGAAAGKALLLVGTGVSHPFLLTEAVRVAKDLGLTLYLLDKPKARKISKNIVPDSHFIPADIGNPQNEAAIASQIAIFAGKNAIDAVVSFLDPLASLTRAIVAGLGIDAASPAHDAQKQAPNSGAIEKGVLAVLGLTPEKLVKQGAIAQIRSLPRSYLFGFTPGWVVNAIGGEIQAVALPLFTATLFDVPTALLVTAVGYVLRIVGTWIGSSLMKRYNPVKVNNAALLAVALAGIGLAVVGMAGASSGVIFALLLANSVIGGLAYGFTRGVAENLLPRMILGKKDAPTLEMALNFAVNLVELGAIFAALLATVPLLNLVGGPWMMAISSVLIGSASVLYSTIKFAQPWEKAEAKIPSSEPAAKTLSKLGVKDYAPVVFVRFMHFMMYGVLSTVLALSVFNSAPAAGLTIGIYDAGSWIFSLLAALTLLPKRLGRRSTVVLSAAAAAAFLWSAVAFPILPVTAALGGLLGGFLTITTNKWMPFYSKHLSETEYGNLSKWIMTFSVAGMMPVFASVSAIRIFPAVAAVLSMPTLLAAIAAIVSAVAAVIVYMALTSKKD